MFCELATALDRIPAGITTNLSGACIVQVDGQRLLGLVADEGQAVYFVPLESGALRTTGVPALVVDLGALLATSADPGPLPEDEELDLEGICPCPGGVWVVGSASRKRKRPRKDHVDKGRKSVLKRLSKLELASGDDNPHSSCAYRLELRLENGQLQGSLAEAHDLRTPLLSLPLLADFAPLPSKDNGLDIEGVALHEGRLWVGLRGPVLRGWALLARFDADFGAPELFPVDLEGMGIRGLTSARLPGQEPGLLLISGPTMTQAGDYRLWSWVPPEGKALGKAQRLAPIASPAGAKPEGLLYAPEPRLDDPHVVVLMDGPRAGSPLFVDLGQTLGEP